MPESVASWDHAVRVVVTRIVREHPGHVRMLRNELRPKDSRAVVAMKHDLPSAVDER